VDGENGGSESDADDGEGALFDDTETDEGDGADGGAKDGADDADAEDTEHGAPADGDAGGNNN
ncbi:MAG TPA: hypothetical protein DD737_03785, partial [Ruminococcaceae bacterium]|nr:hypothetical protein [Oscillospiraceae bacterium]